MVWITDKTAGIFSDVAMLTMALACICLLISFTLDCAEEYLDGLLKECRKWRSAAPGEKARQEGNQLGGLSDLH